jgi:hypothetical protein
MTDNTHRGIRSAAGEHVIAVLICVTIAFAMLIAYPALAAPAKETAGRAQERANMPIAVATYLDADPRPATEAAKPPSSGTP